jgi:indolepyruvate ferredoxin oxidoreductase alpha subunit
VETVNPCDLDSAVDAFKRARDYPGLSVVIAKQACVITARRNGQKLQAFRVNDKCEGCRICVEFGCPAIEFEDELARINNLCAGCGVCARICPSSAIEVMK